jgi:tRNA nucleotidyltransferase (CCA-adding enzyme)
MTRGINLGSQVERYLPLQIQQLLGAISKEADLLGQRLYLVGGIVRDLLLNHPNLDLDLVTEGDAIVLAKRVAPLTKAKLLVHPHFGTAKLSYDNFSMDIATTRNETYAKPGVLPAVTPADISIDLFRRDFSINAMAISLNCDDYGILIDPCGGKSDLEKHLIRILHPNSFHDDATRILRAFRYRQRLDFEFESQTEQLLRRDVAMLDTISGDRLRDEFELVLKEEHPEHILEKLGEVGVLQVINSSLKYKQNICEEYRKARSLKNIVNQLSSLYLCLLIYHLNKQELKRFVHRLNIPLKLARAFKDTIELRDELCLLADSSIKCSDIYYLLYKYDQLAIKTNAIVSESIAIQANIELFENKLRYVKTSISGDDLRNMDIHTGPAIGNILQIVHRAKLDGEVSSKSEELQLAQSLKLPG